MINAPEIIAVDVGNSSIKIGIADAAGEMQRFRWDPGDAACEGLEWLEQLPAHQCFWSVCSVSERNLEKLKTLVSEVRTDDRFHVITPGDVPLKSNVESRELLGRDRLVAAWHARSLVDDREVVIVDAGTAVTIDLVDAEGVFQGGVIFPGAATNLKSLSLETHNLPNLEAAKKSVDGIMQTVIGYNTETAILRGVFHTQIFAIKNIVSAISSDGAVVTTGGEVELLEAHLPGEWRYEPNLILHAARAIGQTIVNEG